MPLKNRVLLSSLLILLVSLLAIWFAPFAVSHSLRLWVWWKAREQKLTVKIDQIDAPFLRPVVMRGLRMTSAPDAAFHIDVSAAQATVNLNLKAILMRMGGRAIRTLSVEGLHAQLRRNYVTGTTLTESGWATLQKLLPDSLNLGRFDLRVEDGPTVILLRSVSLSASQIEAGRLSADQVTIASPWFRQTFSQLRGATNWQDTRLTLGGLSLTRDLDGVLGRVRSGAGNHRHAPPAVSTATRMSRRCSARLRVGASPVVPFTTSAAIPCATCQSQKA